MPSPLQKYLGISTHGRSVYARDQESWGHHRIIFIIYPFYVHTLNLTLTHFLTCLKYIYLAIVCVYIYISFEAH